MSDEYVSQVILKVNSQRIDDFKSIEEKEFEVRKPIELARKTGFVKTAPRYGVSVEYVIPRDREVFDFAGVENGLIVINFENGKSRTYRGCYCTKIGSVKYDGTNEATCQIEFSAAERADS